MGATWAARVASALCGRFLWFALLLAKRRWVRRSRHGTTGTSHPSACNGRPSIKDQPDSILLGHRELPLCVSHPPPDTDYHRSSGRDQIFLKRTRSPPAAPPLVQHHFKLLGTSRIHSPCTDPISNRSAGRSHSHPGTPLPLAPTGEALGISPPPSLVIISAARKRTDRTEPQVFLHLALLQPNSRNDPPRPIQPYLSSKLK